MKVEIERKFLLASDAWRQLVQRSEYIRDGLIAVSDGRKTRVRIIDDRATLTVKSKRVDGGRCEFEYAIPLADAEVILACCSGDAVSKRRHYVPFGGLVWEIDEYDGLLGGVLLAEVELTAMDQSFEMPPWIGQEVTADAAYRKINLLRARQEGIKAEPPK